MRQSGDHRVFVQVETRRRQGTPWVTMLLVLLCVLSFIGLAVLPPRQRLSLLL